MPLSGRGRPGRRDLPRQTVARVRENCPAALRTGAHIRPEGWHDWNKPYFPATGYYAEFASTGAGSQGQRAAYVHQLTAEEAEKYTFERFWTSISPEG